MDAFRAAACQSLFSFGEKSDIGIRNKIHLFPNFGIEMHKFAEKAVGFVANVFQYGLYAHCTFEYVGDFVVVSEKSGNRALSSNVAS